MPVFVECLEAGAERSRRDTPAALAMRRIGSPDLVGTEARLEAECGE
jgi:hypothetical protein